MTTSTPSTILCSVCHKANEADSRFCRYCGASLEGAVAVTPATFDAVANTPVQQGGNGDHAAFDSAFEGKIDAHAPMLEEDHHIDAAVPPSRPKLVENDGADDEKLTSPAEIDARRARQLLDRAVHLSERGENGAAILACRQSIALAPTSASGYSMLGHLLERTNNLSQAISAYEKAVILNPNSAMERETVNRLREKLGNQKVPDIFHFDDAELFGDDLIPTKTDNKPSAAVVAATSATATSAAAVPAVPLAASEPHIPHISAAAPGLPPAYVDGSEDEVQPETETGSQAAKKAYVPTLAQSLAAQIPAIAPGGGNSDITERRSRKERRVEAIPVTVERRLRHDRRSMVAATTTAGIKAAPIFMGDVAPSGRPWDKMRRNPSYFGRSIPLAGATVLCLGFLLMARSWAVARSASSPTLAAVPSGIDPTPVPQPAQSGAAPQVATSGGNLPALAPVGSSNPSNGWPITSRPPGAGSQAGVPAGSRPAGAGGTGAGGNAAGGNGGGGQGGGTGRRQPNFPQTLAPMPVLPSPAGGSSGTGNTPVRRSGGGGGNMGLPAPDVGSTSSAEPPVNVMQPGGGAALNPSGDGGRNYTRITQGRIGFSNLPRRGDAQAGSAERDANNATRAGQGERAVENLSTAVNADPDDAGYRYQQRAMLFMERGDYSRAADDFQSAITAYNQQVARGVNVSAAQAGIRAARNGLNLALSGRNGN